MLFHTLTSRQTAAALDCLRADRITAGHGPLTSSDELVFRTLLFNFMNRKLGCCWPSTKTIAEVTGLCRRTVFSAIKRLRAVGWLKYWSRRHRVGRRWTQAPNNYELRVPRRWKRSVSECKRCARTTSLFTKIAAGHLMRDPRKWIAPSPAKAEEPDESGPGRFHNMLAGLPDGLRQAMDRFGKAIAAKEAAMES